ncbi:TPA: hypothetical protein R5X24_000176 [Campylobacter coli]|uniref:alpha-2,3-sialyltransferase n=2 Tax=Campylobacter coli TaxID=195 RepID=UPI001494ADAA|nr:alpha-2,3-sialyltransferase [Campylobacter coli]EFU6012318.1 hypothetical protein [Campylobacter coli]EHK8872382.1 hypothetical protein [Campylobacter coli]EHL3239927.1 hypothetical protein [Campylobacter coli]EHL5615107.1 hypothetical protein [Campylobacter coli]EHM7464512.1 hypothetical protein [Campylobacter coli]
MFFKIKKKLSDYIDFNVCYNFERKEMLTGTYAICCAIARGYKEIYLAGMDLFENKEQDAYFYGKGYGIIESIHNKIKIWRLLNFCKIIMM